MPQLKADLRAKFNDLTKFYAKKSKIPYPQQIQSLKIRAQDARNSRKRSEQYLGLDLKTPIECLSLFNPRVGLRVLAQLN